DAKTLTRLAGNAQFDLAVHETHHRALHGRHGMRHAGQVVHSPLEARLRGRGTEEQTRDNGVISRILSKTNLDVALDIPNEVPSAVEVGKGLRAQSSSTIRVEHFNRLRPQAGVPIQAIQGEAMATCIREVHIDGETGSMVPARSDASAAGCALQGPSIA